MTDIQTTKPFNSLTKFLWLQHVGVGLGQMSDRQVYGYTQYFTLLFFIYCMFYFMYQMLH